MILLSTGAVNQPEWSPCIYKAEATNNGYVCNEEDDPDEWARMK